MIQSLPIFSKHYSANVLGKFLILNLVPQFQREKLVFLPIRMPACSKYKSLSPEGKLNFTFYNPGLKQSAVSFRRWFIYRKIDLNHRGDCCVLTTSWSKYLLSPLPSRLQLLFALDCPFSARSRNCFVTWDSYDDALTRGSRVFKTSCIVPILTVQNKAWAAFTINIILKSLGKFKDDATTQVLPLTHDKGVQLM